MDILAKLNESIEYHREEMHEAALQMKLSKADIRAWEGNWHEGVEEAKQDLAEAIINKAKHQRALDIATDTLYSLENHSLGA